MIRSKVRQRIFELNRPRAKALKKVTAFLEKGHSLNSYPDPHSQGFFNVWQSEIRVEVKLSLVRLIVRNKNSLY